MTGGAGLRSFRRYGTRRFVVAAVSGGHFLSHLYVLAFPPLFPLLRDEFGLSSFELGLIPASIALAPLVLQLPVGGLVDRIGAKRVFVVGLVLTSVGVVAAGFAPSYAVLLALALLSGVGQSAFHPADFALLDAVSDAHTRGRAFGAHSFGGFVGLAAGPVVVGTLGLTYGWRAALVAVGVLGFGYAALVQLTMASVHLGQLRAGSDDPTDGRESRTGLADLANPTVVATFAVFAVSTFALAGLETFTAIFAIDLFGVSESVGNLTLTAFLGGVAVGVLVGGAITDRTADHLVVGAGFAVAGATTWLVAAVGDAVGVAGIVALVAFVGVATGSAFPARDNLVAASATRGTTGKSFGLAYTAVSVGLFGGPVVLGFVIDRLGAPTAFGLVGGFYLLATAITAAIWLALSVGRDGSVSSA